RIISAQSPKPIFRMNKLTSALFALLLCSCHYESEKSNHRIIKEEDFEVISLTSKKLYFEQIINPSNIGLVGKNVLISEAWRVPEQHPRIHIINSKDWTYNKPKGKYGEGPLEVVDATLFFEGENPDTFWIYSMNRRKLVEYSISDSTLLGKREWKMTEPTTNLWFFIPATDSTYLGISKEDKNRIVEFDKAGNRTGGYGEWEKVKDRPDLNVFQMTELNSSFFKGNPEEGLFTRVSLRRDRLEIFDNHTKSFIIIDGPDLQLPPFELIETEGIRHFYLGPDPSYHYRDAAVTEKYVFALYAGVRHS